MWIDPQALTLKANHLEPVYTTEHGSLFQGDCMELLRTLDDESVDLVFADPPFNLNKDYGQGVNDSLSESEYLSWCEAWIKECVRIISPGGAFYLFNIPKWNIELGHTLNESGMSFRHWITIDIKYGLPIANKLYPSHYSLLYYIKGKKPRSFTRPRLPIAACRHCGGDIKDYGGHRNKLHPDGINLTDVWSDIPPVRHARTKRRGANELSEKLLERVLTISSGPGDVVLDPFGGSGTTYAVADRMHRKWLGVELGDTEPIVRRLRGDDAQIELPGLGDSGKGMKQPKAAK
ncbi:adenine specific DNA methylase Mod [Mycobacteroides abscessus subsp. massiliense]|uniref:DNA-methyltransferase n=1 Tax=Mycobacteroides abscessus TaxID=36809 RepID=UPI0009A66CF2|nr:site-specific DNA-methyltransferase [Mycobacteroides abscessus]SLH43807.1 adenine specific DNA methylase Mod [Mycobacteroides abscessus subsp. massiliense]